ncbi:BTB/POZ domain-containing protein 9-like isoform X1 [Amblyomma americanum]
MFAFNFKKFLETGQYSDVDFNVKSEKYPVSKTFKGHRQLLAMKNEVFGAMFYGPLAEKDTVVIKDLHPDGFYSLLKYLYKGKPNINSVEEAIYTRSAAGKYLVPELELACTLYIKAHVKAEQVCRVIDCLMLSDGGNIDEVVDVLLKENPEQVLASDAFTDCHEQAVHYVLDKMGPRLLPEERHHGQEPRACQEIHRSFFAQAEVPGPDSGGVRVVHHFHGSSQRLGKGRRFRHHERADWQQVHRAATVGLPRENASLGSPAENPIWLIENFIETFCARSDEASSLVHGVMFRLMKNFI